MPDKCRRRKEIRIEKYQSTEPATETETAALIENMLGFFWGRLPVSIPPMDIRELSIPMKR
jgi:hypothetical protein